MRDVPIFTASRISNTVGAREAPQEPRVAAGREALLAATAGEELTPVVQVYKARCCGE